MKKLFTLIGGLVLLSKLAIANDPSLGFGQFSSREFPNQNGKIPIEFNWEVDKDREMIGKPEFNLPHGWKLFSTPVCYPFKSLSEKRVIKVIGILLYPHKTLPFFPQEIKVTQSFKSKSGTVKLSTSGIVYFTPYRTTELWSAEDFADLSRVWHTAQSQIDTNRRFIARKSIPKSDVKQDYQVLERWQDDLQMIFVKGLAYSIPRKAIHPDTLEAMYERGEVEEFQADDPPESISTFARVGGKTFDGSVSGRLVVRTTNDFGVPVTIPLAGVRIRLMEQDIGINEEFGQVYSDANGNFSISYSRRQSFAEGKNVELFLVYHTYNGEYDIKVKKYGVLGPSYEEHTWLGGRGDDLNENRGDINIDNNTFRPLSYAWRCFNFCKNEGFALIKGLNIIPKRKGSSFGGDGVLVGSLPITEPTIRLTEEACNHEGTIYHEFGHFFMWNIQGQNYIRVIEKGKNHSFGEENTSRLAWSEGWASGFAAIMDAAHRWEDGEYASNVKYPTSINIFEIREPGWDGLINNGINSEYFIACAIYDLWDGENKGLPNVIPFTATHGYNDFPNWRNNSIDEAQLSFYQIVRPLQIRSGVFSKINNIDEYLHVFLNDVIGDDCVQRKQISECFQQNRVVYDRRAWEARPGNTALATGGWRTYKTVTIEGGGRSEYNETYSLNADFTQSGQTSTIHAYPFTKAYVTEDITIGTEDSNIDFTAVLNINTDKDSRANPYSTSLITLPETSQDSRVYETCGDPEIRVFNGTLRFGSNEGIPVANMNFTGSSLLHIGKRGVLEINENADIVVKAGSTLFIEAGGKVIIRGDGSLNVEEGAYVCISDEADIQLGPNARLFIDGKAISGVNPQLTFTSFADCGRIFKPGTKRERGCKNEAISFDGVDDYLEIAETNGTLNLGNSDFTMEAIINSSGANVSNSIQIIASKRNVFSPSDNQDADGFMFGLWSSGKLYVQLGGTPNIGWDQGENLIDGSCHHVAVSRSNGIVSFYKDGSLYYSENVGSKNLDSDGSFRIGRNHLSGLPFKGMIGEVRIWNYARSANEISSNMRANLAAQEGLVGYWDMNGNNTFEPDLSGNGNTGRLGSSNQSDDSDPIRETTCDLACNFQGNFRKGSQSDIGLIENAEVDFSIYPNPSNTGKFSIKGINDISKIEVFDTNGSATNFVFENGQLSLHQYAKGVYLVVISKEGKRHTKMVVLN